MPFNEVKNLSNNKSNREFNRGHVNKLKKQWLESSDLIPAATVNVVTNHIIDGQHRVEAYKELMASGELPSNTFLKVMLVSIPEKDERKAIVSANTNSKNWTADDYIKSYAKAGKEDYIKLTEWCRSHQLANANGKPKYIYGAAIITGRTTVREEILGDRMQISDSDFELANEIHAEMVEIANCLNLVSSNSWVTTLAASWRERRDLYTWKEWFSELKNKSRGRNFQMLPKQSKRDFDRIFGEVGQAIELKRRAA